MRPGAWSAGGFLGPDERLTEVLRADAEVLQRLGVTGEQIAAALERLVAAGASAPRRRTRVPPHFDVRISVFKGFQICPWTKDQHVGQCAAGGAVRFASVDWRIENRRTGQVMHGPGLGVHLIRHHTFFEGHQSPYRMDPRDLAGLLDLR